MSDYLHYLVIRAHVTDLEREADEARRAHARERAARKPRRAVRLRLPWLHSHALRGAESPTR